MSQFECPRVTFRVPVRLRDVEKRMIEETLRFFSGNQTKAAEALGISIRTMSRKVKEFQIDLAQYRYSDE